MIKTAAFRLMPELAAAKRLGTSRVIRLIGRLYLKISRLLSLVKVFYFDTALRAPIIPSSGLTLLIQICFCQDELVPFAQSLPFSQAFNRLVFENLQDLDVGLPVQFSVLVDPKRSIRGEVAYLTDKSERVGVESSAPVCLGL